MIFSCMLVACLIAAFAVGILFAIAFPPWILVVVQSILIISLVCFIVKPKRRR